ncbi:MAG: alpha-galactosidase [Clostridia bacterium]|nr:alpha-galactosidase [Clostridia bacterium]
MIDILRTPDDIRIYCDRDNVDTVVTTEIVGRKMQVKVTATESKPKMICLRWKCKITEPTRVMGDRWERSYGDMSWNSLNGEIFMPWYFLASNGKTTVGCGVMVRPSSYVCFQCDANGVSAWFDVRCGGVGVDLGGRELLAGEIVCEKYEGISEIDAATKFCSVMCEDPIFPREAVYGSNNWYYAYGKSSYEEITEDAAVIAQLAKGNSTPPFMVIDDGWQKNPVEGPWIPNERYGDMSGITAEFKNIGVRPGIWFRPLHNTELETAHPDWCICHKEGKKAYLDPSHPDVKEYIKKTIEDIKGWGFELIKHDYSTFDMFGDYGNKLNGCITNYKGWSFYDKTKTSAQITLDFYKLIREAAGEMYIIGCNTVSHLCAGLVEINRIGNDTSGMQWNTTRANGVNTLAFRMCQNNTFYKIDADCVGLMEKNIDWRLNRQWLDLLARSGSPLFVSMQPSQITDAIADDLKKAFEISSRQTDVAKPMDWLYNNTPQLWEINGETVVYDFVMDDYPLPAKEIYATLSPSLMF